MSPAPQGNLEVERYIGSYLISQRVPPNVKNSGNKRYQNHQNVKQKNPSCEPEKPRNFNKYCFPQRDHHVGVQGRYTMPPGQMPLPVDCQGYNHYGKHNPNGVGWAGVPLISMTSGNHRRNKKAPSTTNPNQTQKFSHKQHTNQQHCYAKGKDSEENPHNDTDRSPLTRLAIHTQGAPLIQAGRYNNNRCRSFNRDQSSRVFRGDANRWEAGKEAKPSTATQNKDQVCGNTDSSSVASDESSGNSENSLPRIIKPRKRRKKDRKPITGTNTVVSSSIQNETPQYTRESGHSADLPKLNNFLPLCFEQKNCSEGKAADLLSENILISTVEEKQHEDLIDPLASADEFPFGNLLDDDEDNHSELSTCTPTTLCQCRYCDPSGVIWDVDQRCYSPFLTPPSPTEGKLHFTNHLPLAFSHISKSYNRQVAIVEPPSSHSHYSFNSDMAGSFLRRSWSDTSSASYLNRQPNVNFPEGGQEKNHSRPSSPAGLQVSSEIVTSPINGHRDIEIKFFSSSSPLDSSKTKISVCDRDLSDRCFIVEE